MTRRTVAFLVGAFLVGAFLVAACATQPPPTPDVSSPVEGVVIAVDSTSLTNVKGFTLRPIGIGFSFGFTLGPLENATEFSPSHLAEHLATSEPIRAYFRTENGVHVVYRLEDASAPAST